MLEVLRFPLVMLGAGDQQGRAPTWPLVKADSGVSRVVERACVPHGASPPPPQVGRESTDPRGYCRQD